MSFKLIVTIVFASFFNLQVDSAFTNKIICYYESLTNSFAVEDIDVNSCTHVNFAYLGISQNGTLRPLDDNALNVIYRFSRLKEKNKKLKLLFSVGGWAQGSMNFSLVSSSPNLRRKFASDAVDMIRRHNFDGLDIDWEFPTVRGGYVSDKENFVRMLQDLRDAFKPFGFLLSAVVAKEPFPAVYDVKRMSDLLDIINLMTFDYNFGSESRTAANAPLYDVTKSLKSWIQKGASRDKIALGLPFYGHSFTLKNRRYNGYGERAVGEGKPGPISDNKGYLEYREICENDWRKGWDIRSQTPYKYKGDQWVSYDNPLSLAEKIELAKRYRLFGVMIWTINKDDINGVCGEKNDLLKSVNRVIKARRGRGRTVAERSKLRRIVDLLRY